MAMAIIILLRTTLIRTYLHIYTNIGSGNSDTMSKSYAATSYHAVELLITNVRGERQLIKIVGTRLNLMTIEETHHDRPTRPVVLTVLVIMIIMLVIWEMAICKLDIRGGAGEGYFVHICMFEINID